MFKLVCIGGTFRGQEWELKDGLNVIGKSPDCQIIIDAEGVSKKHFSININKGSAYIQDLKSSNGTLVNNKLASELTLQVGDIIALPNVIFKVIHVEEKVTYKKVKVKPNQNNNQDLSEEHNAPKNLPGKLFHLFRYKVMPIFYNFNEQYEWRAMIAILLFLLIILNVTFTIFPILRDSKKLLLYEITQRGIQFGQEVARHNTVHMARKEYDLINTSYLDAREEGLVDYELVDTNGRIIRPIEKMNSITTDSFTVKSLNYYRQEKEYDVSFKEALDDGVIGIAKAIIAHDVDRAQNSTVGFIILKFRPISLMVEAARNSMAYLEAIITSSLVCLFFYGIIYYLTLFPIRNLAKQIDEILRGRRNELDNKYKFEELTELKKILTVLIHKYRELSGLGGDSQLNEPDSDYVSLHQNILQGINLPGLVLNSSKHVSKLNNLLEDIIGIREASSLDSEFIEVCRDQGLASKIVDLMDKCSSSDGKLEVGDYEILGKSFSISVTSLIGKDQQAKSYLIIFNEQLG